MKGMTSFETTRELTLDELADFMRENWDTNVYSSFIVGDPMGATGGTEYVVLPATSRWCVIVYPKTSGLFKKKNEIKLACTYTSEGIGGLLKQGSLPARYETTGEKIRRSKEARDSNAEMNKVADPIMREYASHLQELMRSAGLA